MGREHVFTPGPLKIMNDIGVLRTKNGHWCIVDAWLMPHLTQFKWSFSKGYFYTSWNRSKRGLRCLSRILSSAGRGMIGEHKNGHQSDNRSSNLRIATYSQNAANSKKPVSGTSSRYKGVSKNGKYWKSMIIIEAQRIYLGSFCTEKDAAAAYDLAAKEKFGEFAKPQEIQ